LLRRIKFLREFQDQESLKEKKTEDPESPQPNSPSLLDQTTPPTNGNSGSQKKRKQDGLPERPVDTEVLPFIATMPAIDDLVHHLFSVCNAKKRQEQEQQIIINGICHFFGYLTKNGPVLSKDFQVFLKLFGPLSVCLDKVYGLYREGFFHGFVTHGDTIDLLKDKPNHFMFRFSETQLKDGFYAFAVNKEKKKGSMDQQFVVEHYSLRYSNDEGCFIFRNSKYDTIHDFIVDPQYSRVFQKPLQALLQDVVKKKYQDPKDLMDELADEMNTNLHM